LSRPGRKSPRAVDAHLVLADQRLRSGTRPRCASRASTSAISFNKKYIEDALADDDLLAAYSTGPRPLVLERRKDSPLAGSDAEPPSASTIALGFTMCAA
jgi:hypothetical protein